LAGKAAQVKARWFLLILSYNKANNMRLFKTSLMGSLTTEINQGGEDVSGLSILAHVELF
jgi:hypothetical protein